MTVTDFEEKVWEIDSIRVVIRAQENEIIDDFDWTNAAPQTQNVTSWLATRITPKAGEHGVVVLGGNGEEPHGRMLLRTLRASYVD